MTRRILLPSLTPARRRTLTVAAGLGIDADSAAAAHGALARRLAPLAAQVLLMPAGACVLVSGPSGAGKSTLLRLTAVGARRRGVRVVHTGPLSAAQKGRTVAAQRAAMPLGTWVRLLAAVGLAEARVLITPAGGLSQGQSARLRLALAAARCLRMARAGPVLLVADDWCAALDGPAALSLCAGVRRWLAGAGGVRLLCAATDGTLGAALRPDLHISADTWEPVEPQEQGGGAWMEYGSNPAA